MNVEDNRKHVKWYCKLKEDINITLEDVIFGLYKDEDTKLRFIGNLFILETKWQICNQQYKVKYGKKTNNKVQATVKKIINMCLSHKELIVNSTKCSWSWCYGATLLGMIFYCWCNGLTWLIRYCLWVLRIGFFMGYYDDMVMYIEVLVH